MVAPKEREEVGAAAQYARLETIVREIFPTAEPTEAWGMKGWRVKRRSSDEAAEWNGTIDARYVLVLPAFRKAGLTIHLIHPAQYAFLEAPRARLESAGFGVMRGCITWKRKSELAWESLRQLLRELKDSASV